MELTNKETTEMTLSITMTISQWKELDYGITTKNETGLLFRECLKSVTSAALAKFGHQEIIGD